MSLVKAALISAALFFLGVYVQSFEVRGLTDSYLMPYYLTLYLSGLLFIPVYPYISKLFKKKKKD